MRYVEKALGRVRALYLGPVTRGPMQARQKLALVAGRGIEGDRYGRPRPGDRPAAKGLALTLIAEEGIRQMRAEGLELDFADTRRNVITSGVDLEDLLGEEFDLGSAIVRGVALNPPCARLERLTGIPGLKRMMAGRGGIRADVVRSGEVRVGDLLIAGCSVQGHFAQDRPR